MTQPAHIHAPELPSRHASLLGRVFGPVLERRTWLSFAYLLTGLATGTAYFSIAVTGIAVSAGLAVLIVGLPFAAAFLGFVRALSHAEGRLIESLLDAPVPSRPLGTRAVPADGPDQSTLARIRVWFKDRRTWSTLAYLVLQLPLGVIYFTLLVTGLWLSAWLVTSPLTQTVMERWLIPLGGGKHVVFEPWTYPLFVLGGIALFLVTVHGARSVARAHAEYAKSMLLPWAPSQADARSSSEAGRPPSFRERPSVG